jgi:hypothetical protein
LKVEQLPKLDLWLRSILWDSKLPGVGFVANDDAFRGVGLEVHRLKARLPLSDGNIKIVQAVREVFDIIDDPAIGSSTLPPKAPVEGKVVLIGRNLLGLRFEESFNIILNS